MDSVSSGAFKYLSTLSDLTSLLGSFPASDSIVANAGKPWLFNGDMLATVEGSSSIALVCLDVGTYSAADDLSTPQFFRLGVEIWVDPLRDSALNVIESSASTIDRGKRAFTTLNFHLHRTSGETQMWGDLRTVGCRLLTGPQFLPTEDIGTPRASGQGMNNRPQVGTAYYGVTAFGYTDVPA